MLVLSLPQQAVWDQDRDHQQERAEVAERVNGGGAEYAGDEQVVAEHPELGAVELGGWDSLYAFRNPPAKFLEREISPFPRWILFAALISPKLELREASATPLGGDTYRVRLVVEDTGWLPTYVTKLALEKQLTRGVIAEIALPEGATLESGKPREERGQLEGRAYKPSAPIGWAVADPTEDRLKVEWVVRAPQGGTVELVARHERAGTVRAAVDLTP